MTTPRASKLLSLSMIVGLLGQPAHAAGMKLQVHADLAAASSASRGYAPRRYTPASQHWLVALREIGYFGIDREALTDAQAMGPVCEALEAELKAGGVVPGPDAIDAIIKEAAGSTQGRIKAHERARRAVVAAAAEAEKERTALSGASHAAASAAEAKAVMLGYQRALKHFRIHDASSWMLKGELEKAAQDFVKRFGAEAMGLLAGE